MAKWLWSQGLTLEDARSENNRALQLACANGHLAVAEWLWSLGLTLADARSCNNYALRLARDYGHEAVVRWPGSLEEAQRPQPAAARPARPERAN